ncbi:MAG: DUF1425 domain-containing protein [Phycisphaerae bacterium]
MNLVLPLKWLWGLLMSLAAVALVGGCQTSSVNTFEPAAVRVAPQPEMLARIITDEDLSAEAYVDSVYVTDTTDAGDPDLLRVQVNLVNRQRNTRPKARQFQYKFDWYDARGMVISDPTNQVFKTVLISPRQFRTLTGTAPSPAAVDWQLSLRDIDN